MRSRDKSVTLRQHHTGVRTGIKFARRVFFYGYWYKERGVSFHQTHINARKLGSNCTTTKRQGNATKKKIETAERGEVHAFSVRLTAASTFFF